MTCECQLNVSPENFHSSAECIRKITIQFIMMNGAFIENEHVANVYSTSTSKYVLQLQVIVYILLFHHFLVLSAFSVSI